MSKDKNLTTLTSALKEIDPNHPNLRKMDQIFQEYKSVIADTFIQGGQKDIISVFYPLYAEAYDKRGHEFCVNYENNLNKLLGVEGVLFYSDEG